ncbi:hypothetical protein E1176_15330 [Fulvivirga sp. RKSG066]|uniref:hypothetical protein n=1 Tax=Fulvivirga aurantia TaxID=2529383 RepID=UPI0012BBAC33|nr:hypothetical protein [Fulvivirga aurantia]MTI22403.1 hypothetical protein [Fulvivirga aurantia]
MKSKVVILLLLVCQLPGLAQKLIPRDSFLTKGVETASVDQSGNIYLANSNGSLKKYTSAGEFLVEFSPQKKGNITLVEAFNQLKIFIFYEYFQEYLYLDRFLTNSNRFDAREITDFAGLITSSMDDNLWVVDLVDFGLKKFNITYGQFTIQTSFDLILDPDNYDITYLREYQGKVFMSDSQSGIMIFDNLGNYLQRLDYKNVNYFNFIGNELYFLQNNEIILYDLYNKIEKRIPLNKTPFLTLISGNQLWTIDKKYVRLYDFRR